MDILESLTSDFDHLRDLTIDYALAESTPEREQLFRQLSRYHDVTAKAQVSVLEASDVVEVVEFAKRKMLERCDVMEEIALSITRSNRTDIRAAKMDLYSDLLIQRITDCERDILPYIYERLSEPERVQMGISYAKYRDIALDLDRPHSHAV
jgi:hypothetical protein